MTFMSTVKYVLDVNNKDIGQATRKAWLTDCAGSIVSACPFCRIIALSKCIAPSLRLYESRRKWLTRCRGAALSIGGEKIAQAIEHRNVQRKGCETKSRHEWYVSNTSYRILIILYLLYLYECGRANGTTSLLIQEVLNTYFSTRIILVSYECSKCRWNWVRFNKSIIILYDVVTLKVAFLGSRIRSYQPL